MVTGILLGDGMLIKVLSVLNCLLGGCLLGSVVMIVLTPSLDNTTLSKELLITFVIGLGLVINGFGLYKNTLEK